MKKLTKAIVTTTINPPTVALKKFLKFKEKGWDTIFVAGDLKTRQMDYWPKDSVIQDFEYLSPIDQHNIHPLLSEAIGWNCIQRRNFAIFEAWLRGYDLIALVDDDNIPDENWGDDLYIDDENSVKSFGTECEVFDPLSITDHNYLWHRGFPLELVSLKNRIWEDGFIKGKFSVQANLWNGSPDVDAVCREIYNPNVEFHFHYPITAYTSRSIMPFNSQNTILTREVVPFYFLYPHVGRMDDIWAAYTVQALGWKVVFSEPTVYQQRNPHKFVKDFSDEILGYTKNYNMLLDIKFKGYNAIIDNLPERSKHAFRIWQGMFEQEWKNV